MKQSAYTTPSGKRINDFYTIERADYIMIVPITVDNKFVLVQQYRHGVDREILNFTAGFCERGENALKTAKRELHEETGYVAQRITKLGTFLSKPPIMKTKFTIYLAEGCTKKTSIQGSDTDEIENIKLYSSKRVESLIKRSKLNDANSVLAYLLARDKLNRGLPRSAGRGR